MRIRPPELETRICDVKYRVSLSTRCVLGKWIYLVTHGMSLFDLQDVCIAIGSLSTLDIPMVVDLIGIYVLKGPYCMLTTTDWFLQELSVIPRGSWGDVSRRFTMIRWVDRSDQIVYRSYDEVTPPPLLTPSPTAADHHAPPAVRRLCSRDWTCSDHVDDEIPFMSNSSALLVQTGEGVLFPVVDRIRRSTAAYLECQFPCQSGRIQAPR
ncbi:hypothetical protein F511_37277 [Dorcoceras hygrometricum]|uniref:Uncharacterized protein n=1 Tax=Dorcoceras hygrometricum TaxID=472368 RepID=A0A2Z7CI38_9LAMI|nr:hypothetical protein F511_37277 [Dorcoceras hygrometricum]